MIKKEKVIMVSGHENYLLQTIKELGESGQFLCNEAYVLSQKKREVFGGVLTCGDQDVTLVNFNLLLTDAEEQKVPYAKFAEDVSCFVAIFNKKAIKKNVNFLLAIQVPIIIITTEPLPKKIVKRLKMADVPVIVSDTILVPSDIQKCIERIDKKSSGYHTAETKLVITREK